MAASLSWLALVFVGLVHAAGGDPPRAAEILSALVAAPIAVAGAIQAVAAVWRGPTIVAFRRADAVPCSPAEATFVRSSAQLRGTMGGAGHLYRGRLAFPALSWSAAGLVGVAALVERFDHVVGAWPVAVATTSAFVALLFPARAFFYRETTGGGTIVNPPSAAYRLKRRAELSAAIARGEQVEATTPAPTPPPAGLVPSQARSQDPAA